MGLLNYHKTILFVHLECHISYTHGMLAHHYLQILQFQFEID